MLLLIANIRHSEVNDGVRDQGHRLLSIHFHYIYFSGSLEVSVVAVASTNPFGPSPPVTEVGR